VPFNKIVLYQPRLVKLVVPPSTFADIRFWLDQYGINQSTVFPGLDGLSRHIEWLHTILEDEKHLRRTIANMSWELPT